MELATARLLLRDFVQRDFAAFAAYHADPRYGEFYAREDLRPGRAAELVSMFLRWAAERPRQNYQLAIVLDGELIGCGGVRTRGLPKGRAELGVELAPRAWGAGYATETARALLAFARRELGVEEVHAAIAAANVRSANLVRRLGFERVSRTEWRLPLE